MVNIPWVVSRRILFSSKDSTSVTPVIDPLFRLSRIRRWVFLVSSIKKSTPYHEPTVIILRDFCRYVILLVPGAHTVYRYRYISCAASFFSVSCTFRTSTFTERV